MEDENKNTKLGEIACHAEPGDGRKERSVPSGSCNYFSPIATLIFQCKRQGERDGNVSVGDNNDMVGFW